MPSSTLHLKSISIRPRNDKQAQVFPFNLLIIMAFPNATILSLNSAQLRHVAYNELEHVTLTKAFLNDPEAYLRHL